MLKMNVNLLDVPLDINGVATLVVEDTACFSSLIRLFYGYEEDCPLKLVHGNYVPLKPLELMLVSDVLGYDINSSATLKLIYTDLEQQLKESPEVVSKIDQLTDKISSMIGDELLNHELDLEKDEITILELFKALGVKIETQSDTIYEKMLEIVQVYKYLRRKKLLVFINTSAYLTGEEMKELQQYISLNQIDVLFLEPRKRDGFPQTVVDRDFYIYTENMV